MCGPTRTIRPSGDVLKIQDQIAASLVRALQVTVGADDLQSRPSLTRTEAYDLYCGGDMHTIVRPIRIRSCCGIFSTVLDSISSSGRAAEWLANTLEALPNGAMCNRSKDLSVRAWRTSSTESEPTLHHGALHSGTINLIYDWDWAAAKRESETALALDPRNSQSIAQQDRRSRQSVDGDEGARLIGAALAIDPLFAGWHEILGNIRFREGNIPRPRQNCEKRCKSARLMGRATIILDKF